MDLAEVLATQKDKLCAEPQPAGFVLGESRQRMGSKNGDDLLGWPKNMRPRQCYYVQGPVQGPSDPNESQTLH